MAFIPTNVDAYSSSPPSTDPQRFEPSEALVSARRRSRLEKITPAENTGSAYSSPAAMPRGTSGSAFSVPAEKNQIATIDATSGAYQRSMRTGLKTWATALPSSTMTRMPPNTHELTIQVDPNNRLSSVTM